MNIHDDIALIKKRIELQRLSEEDEFTFNQSKSQVDTDIEDHIIEVVETKKI